jgi:hypothetical protein
MKKTEADAPAGASQANRGLTKRQQRLALRRLRMALAGLGSPDISNPDAASNAVIVADLLIAELNKE